MSDLRRCTQCGEHKPVSDYHCRSNGKPNFGKCKLCRAEQQRKKYAEDEEWRRKIAAYGRERHLRTRHKMTMDECEAFFAEHGHQCAICGSKEMLHIDHWHGCCPGGESCEKCRRGLLCTFCNRAVGLFNDDPDRLRRAADYVSRLCLL